MSSRKSSLLDRRLEPLVLDSSQAEACLVRLSDFYNRVASLQAAYLPQLRESPHPAFVLLNWHRSLAETSERFLSASKQVRVHLWPLLEER